MSRSHFLKMCTQGEFFSDSSTCLKCEKGYYTPNGYFTKCLPCPPSTFGPDTGLSECLPCKNQYYQDQTGQVECIYCNFILIKNVGCITFEYMLLPFFLGILIPLAFISIIFLLRTQASAKNNKPLEDEEKDAFTFDPPTKRALEILSRIRPKVERKKDVLKQLDLVIELVKNTGRNTNPMSRIGPELDDDFKQFLLNTGFGDASTIKKGRKSFKNRSRKNTSEERKISFSVVGANLPPSNRVKSLASTEQEDLESKINMLTTKVFNLTEFKSVEEMLSNAAQFPWDFDIFKFCDITNNHPIVFMGYFLLKQRGLIGKYGLRDQNVLKFFDEVELSYNENPYHNNIHACDVMYTTATFLNHKSLKQFVSDKEYLATIVASCIHDIEHPGVSNIFLIRSKDNLAMIYSDQSVLEYHHCYQGFNIATLPEHNIFEGFNEEEYFEIRKLIIDLVLATDMSKHFDFLNKFKNMCAINPNLCHELHNDDNRRFILLMALKCADLSNPAKPFQIYMEWCSRIMEEFFCQGDLEKTLKLPISKFMDRQNCDIAKCQVICCLHRFLL
eukprot:NODE_91_length_21779_cov_0.171356.p2 type:complete len:559 gc:universal NODE_91_length_21779_cov_0.171356:405-2081(+)